MFAASSAQPDAWCITNAWRHAHAAHPQIKFAVTKKGKVGDDSGIAVVLACTWPYLLWLCAFLAGVIFFLTGCLLGSYNAREVAVSTAAGCCAMLRLC